MANKVVRIRLQELTRVCAGFCDQAADIHAITGRISRRRDWKRVFQTCLARVAMRAIIMNEQVTRARRCASETSAMAVNRKATGPGARSTLPATLIKRSGNKASHVFTSCQMECEQVCENSGRIAELGSSPVKPVTV
jgi:hypothetical protein